MNSCIRVPVFVLLAALWLALLSANGLAQQAKDDQAATAAKAAKGSTLVAASNMLHPPFSSWDKDQQAIGIEVDIVNEAAKGMDRQTKWVEKEFGDLIDAVASGEIDIAVSTIGVTTKRQQKVAFSEPYFETQIVAMVVPNSSFDSLDSLSQARIGADKATTSYQAAKARWPNATLVGEVREGMKWPEMLQQKLIDAFIVDASDQSRLETQSAVKLAPIPEPLKTESFAIVVNKNAAQLLAAINEQVAKQRPLVRLKVGGEYQFTTPTGRKLSSLESPLAKLVGNYLNAKEAYLADQDDANKLIWFGRRAGYLLRLNEAIQIFTQGIEKHPEDPRIYRHRGHRYISTRQFDKAIADLEKAAKLIEGKPNRKEPDGAPNAQGIELTTTHGNIWYHLGLAYYLKNNMVNAERCFLRCLKLADNDDGIVSASHWLYMILRRQGQAVNVTRAIGLVKRVSPDMTIIENMTYHQMCLFYSGRLQEADLLSNDKDNLGGYMRQSVADVILYGLGNWHGYENRDKQKCRAMYEKLMAEGSPFSFAFIAAEADYVRVFAKQ